MAGKMEELIAALAEQQIALVEQQKAQQDQIGSLIDALHQKLSIGNQIEVGQPIQGVTELQDFNDFGSTKMTQNQNRNLNVIKVKTVQPTQTFAANHDFNDFGSPNMTQNQNSNQNDNDFSEFDSTDMSQIQNENQNLNISASNYSDELIHSHQIGDCIDLSKTIGSSISICSGPIDSHKSASNLSDELIYPHQIGDCRTSKLIPELASSKTNHTGGNFSNELINPHRNSDYTKSIKAASNLTLKSIDSFGISDCSTLNKNVCEQNVVSSHRGSLSMKIPIVGRPTKMSEVNKNVCEQNVVSSHRGSLSIKIPNNGRPTKMSELNFSSSYLIIRKPVENSKSKISKNIINSVPNASDSNISDEVKTKELDKSFTSSNLVSGISEIYSVDINKGLKSKDSSGEANSTLRAKSSNLKFP